MPTSRRRVLSAPAVLLSGGVAGALLASSTDTATAAAADASLSVTGDEIEVRENRIAAVWLTVDVDWSYEIPSEESPSYLELTLLAGSGPDDMTTVATDESEQYFLEMSDSESFEVDLLEADVLESDDLVPGEGGEITDTEVHLGVEMRLYDKNDLVIAADSQTDTATIAVTKSAYNPDEYGSVSGSGELTVELE